MRDFNKNNRSGGGRSGQRYGGRDSGRRSFGGRDSARTMYKATCAECGNDCEVPFQPSGDRPVYCSKCFEKMSNEDGSSRGSDKRNYRISRFEERRTSLPADGIGNATVQLSGQIVEQLRSLNTKLDKIISALEPKVAESRVIETKAKKSKASKKKVSEEKVEV
jgi:CxxC-x17-CxxC domain-containing protein